MDKINVIQLEIEQQHFKVHVYNFKWHLCYFKWQESSSSEQNLCECVIKPKYHNASCIHERSNLHSYLHKSVYLVL
jgi:hypothetical protein